MSDIDDVIDTLDLRGHGNIVGGMILRARAELAQLRADLAAAQERIVQQAAQLEQERDTIAGQAHQIEQANNLIRRIFEMADSETSTVEIESDSLMWQIEADTRAWLSANARQPQEQEV